MTVKEYILHLALVTKMECEKHKIPTTLTEKRIEELRKEVKNERV